MVTVRNSLLERLKLSSTAVLLNYVLLILVRRVGLYVEAQLLLQKKTRVKRNWEASTLARVSTRFRKKILWYSSVKEVLNYVVAFLSDGLSPTQY